MYNKDYILIIGGSNADITGFPNSRFIPRDSNPGAVGISAGGVGRNIAENIARLQIPVKLLSVVGNDAFGDLILNESSAAGIDTSTVIRSKTMPTSAYLCIMDEARDLFAAVSDMKIMSELTSELIHKNSFTLKNAASVIIDNNIDPETIAAVKKENPRRILFDAVSGKKLRRSIEQIRDIDTVKLNEIEAEILSGIKITCRNDAEEASAIIFDRCIDNIFITLGAGGAHYRCTNGSYFCEPYNLPLKNTTGAGDAFLAGIAYGYYNEITGKELLEYGNACAAAAAASEETVSDRITPELIRQIIEGDNDEIQ